MERAAGLGGVVPPDEKSPLLGHAAPRQPPCRSYPHGQVNGFPQLSHELRTLLTSSALCFVFFIIELVGGYIAHSLAVMADAAHLLSDLVGFLISVVAVTVSQRPANATLTFGFARAEVLGAFVSILLIWVLTAILLFYSVERLFRPHVVNGHLMLLLGVIGLVVNIVMGLVLGHSHSDSSHSHAHDLAEHSNLYGPGSARYGHEDGQEHREHEHDEQKVDLEENNIQFHREDAGDAVRATEGPFLVQLLRPLVGQLRKLHKIILGRHIDSINVLAAYLHVLGDALQNIGVIVAAGVIIVAPSWSFVDPLCTIFFACLVIATTRKLARQTLSVLMEGTPENCSTTDIYNALVNLEGVREVADLHVWSITARRPALSVHILPDGKPNEHDLLKRAQRELKRFGIAHSTIQVNCEAPECCDEDLRHRSEHCVAPDDFTKGEKEIR